MAASRSAGQNRFALTIDGLSCGILRDCQPGLYKAEVVEIAVAHSFAPKKTINQPKLEAFQFKIGIQSAGKPLQSWFQDALDMKTSRRNGTLQRADFDNKIHAEIQFTEALPGSLKLPECKGDSKEPGFFDFSFQPETSKTVAASGTLPAQDVAAAQKQWIQSNFRFAVDGMNEGCKRVFSVGSLEYKMEHAWDQIGDRRTFDLIPSKASFSNWKVSVSESDAADWLKWYQDFIIDGKTAEEVGEKTGSLEYLTPALDKTLCTVDLSNMGLLSIAVEKDDKGGSGVRRLTLEGYLELMKIAFAG